MNDQLHMPRSTASMQIFKVLAMTMALALGLMMISPDSFWIDELATLRVTDVDDFSTCMDRTVHSSQSESQMIGYMAYGWMWGQLAGDSEWTIRLSNLPWLLLASLCLAQVGRSLELRWLVLLLLIHPFVWYYANEFRPYLIQIASGCIVLYSLTEFIRLRGQGVAWAIALMIAVLVMCLSSMLAAITTLVFYATFLFFGVRGKFKIQRTTLLVLLTGNLLLVALGGYYLWTLMSGAGGAKLWDIGIGNLFYATYEFAGFGGLGPARDSLRELARNGNKAALQALLPYVLGLVCLGVCYLLLFMPKGSNGKQQSSELTKKVERATWVILLGNVAMLLALSIVAKWPFWGRHLATVFPCFILLIAVQLEKLQHTKLGKPVVAVFLLLLFGSSLMLRFSPDHRKDDYRGAAQLAETAIQENQTVWWAARNVAKSRYYGEFLQSENAQNQWHAMMNPTENQLRLLAKPDTIFLSKHDIYDQHEAIRKVIAGHGYQQTAQLKTFSVWKLPVQMPTNSIPE